MSDIRPPPGGYAPPPPPDRGGSGVGRGRGAGPQRANSFQTYAQPAYHMMPTTSYQVYPQSYNPYPQYYPQDYYQQQWAAPTLHYNPSSGFQPSVAPYPQQVISSTLPPKPSTNFSCDACEQDFSTQHKYQNHIASHQKCPQCDFVASKKVLYVHKDEAHGAGRIIAKNESPEEVAKWIAERKRNYPTDANIAKKKENDRNRQDIGMLERDDNQPGSKKRKRTKPEAPPVENLNGLGMVDAYASSDDGSSDGCEVEAEAPAEGSAKLPLKSPRPKSICRYFAKGHCRMGKRCNFTHEKPVKEDLDKSAATFNPDIKRKNLLRELLRKQIRDENNVLLQCIRHLVKHHCQ